MKRGKFIVIDGMDGSGKGTQIKLLREKTDGYPVMFTREPGGTLKAEEIRKMLLQKDGPPSNPLCDFFLFWASRASHVEDMVGPARRQLGQHVISDRYDSSTWSFQIYGEQQYWLEALFVKIRKSMLQVYRPHAYFFLDLPAEVAHERRKKNAEQEKSRFDLKPLEYHRRVRFGFQTFAEKFGRSHMIDANRPPEQIHDDLWAGVQTILKIK